MRDTTDKRGARSFGSAVLCWCGGPNLEYNKVQQHLRILCQRNAKNKRKNADDVGKGSQPRREDPSHPNGIAQALRSHRELLSLTTPLDNSPALPKEFRLSVSQGQERDEAEDEDDEREEETEEEEEEGAAPLSPHLAALLEKEITLLRKENTRLQQELEKAPPQSGADEDLLLQLNTAVKLHADLETTNTHQTQLQQQNAEMQALKTQLKQQETRLEKLQAASNQAKLDIERARTETELFKKRAEEAEKKVAALSENIQHEDEIERMQELMQASENERWQLRKRAEQAEQELRFLKANPQPYQDTEVQGQANLMVQAAKPQPELKRHILEDGNANANVRNNREQDIVVDRLEEISRGDEAESSSNLKEMENKIRELEKALKNALVGQETAEERIQELVEELADKERHAALKEEELETELERRLEAQSELEELNSSIQEGSIKLVTPAASVRTLESEDSRTEAERLAEEALAEREERLLMKARDRAEAQLENKIAELSLAQASLSRKSTELDLARRKIVELEESRAQAQTDLQQEREKLRVQAEDLQTLQRKVEHLQAQRGQERERRQAQRAQQREQELRGEVERLQAQLRDAVQSLATVAGDRPSNNGRASSIPARRSTRSGSADANEDASARGGRTKRRGRNSNNSSRSTSPATSTSEPLSSPPLFSSDRKTISNSSSITEATAKSNSTSTTPKRTSRLPASVRTLYRQSSAGPSNKAKLVKERVQRFQSMITSAEQSEAEKRRKEDQDTGGRTKARSQPERGRSTGTSNGSWFDANSLTSASTDEPASTPMQSPAVTPAVTPVRGREERAASTTDALSQTKTSRPSSPAPKAGISDTTQRSGDMMREDEDILPAHTTNGGRST
eukprot:g588.t1